MTLTLTCQTSLYRFMIDTPEKYICFIHAKIGASPGWGGANRLVSIVGEKITDVFSDTVKEERILLFFFHSSEY